MIYFNEKRIEKIREGKITAFVEVVNPKPKHTPMCMFKNDLEWAHDWSGSSTVSCKPNGPEDYFKYASYGQKGDYLHINGITLLITNVQVLYADNITGEDRAKVMGCTYSQWYDNDPADDWYFMKCEETDYVFLYHFEYIDTPPMEEMIKLASACKAIAGVANV